MRLRYSSDEESDKRLGSKSAGDDSINKDDEEH